MTQWYDNAIIYQVYPRSFQDSNNDGLGDLEGLLQRLDYIKKLGVNAIWINPVFTSPQVDNGYDVSNYFNIDPHFGSMATMNALIKRAHELDMHIILDFVLNHTSDQHPWFQDALKSPKSLFRDYYIWEQTKNGEVPNNWGSFFGGSVWAKHPSEKNTYYFHLFDQHMPDLNWANPEVRQAMIEVAKYWVEKGVDGLRLDAFIHIAKANLRQDFPSTEPGAVIAEPMYANLPNVVTYLQEFINELRKINPDLFILGEGASAGPELAALYTRSNRGNALCDGIVSFRNLPKERLAEQDPLAMKLHLPAKEQLDLTQLPESIVHWQTSLAQTTQPTLYFSNHDMPRMATAYADSEYFERSLKTLATMQYLQKGVPIIYYGEELGLKNVDLTRFTAFQDQTVTALKNQLSGREQAEVLKYLSQTHKTPARQPMPWDDSANQGFSEHEPWLRTATKQVTVAAEEDDPDSLLNFYRQLLHLKQQELFANGEFCLLTTAPGLIVYERYLAGQAALVVTNLTSDSLSYTNDDWTNADITYTVGQVTLDDKQWHLAPWSSIVLQQDQLPWL